MSDIGKIITASLFGFLALLGIMYWGSFNSFQKREQNVQLSERSMFSCYQKRSDLFTNAANTVSQFANNEKEIQIKVAELRTAAAKTAPPDPNDAAAMQQFADAQKQASGAWKAISVVVEAYPNIKQGVNFLLLQKQLADVETQCNLVRNRYIKEISAYNLNVTAFPTNIVANVHGYTTKPQIKFDDEGSLRSSPRLFQPEKK